MLVFSKLAILNYEMHEPYEYGRLWDIVRAEGLENRLLAQNGTWKKLPNSTWAAAIQGDVPPMLDQLSRRLEAAAFAAGLNVDFFLSIGDGWAWRLTEVRGAAGSHNWLTFLNERQLG